MSVNVKFKVIQSSRIRLVEEECRSSRSRQQYHSANWVEGPHGIVRTLDHNQPLALSPDARRSSLEVDPSAEVHL